MNQTRHDLNVMKVRKVLKDKWSQGNESASFSADIQLIRRFHQHSLLRNVVQRKYENLLHHISKKLLNWVSQRF